MKRPDLRLVPTIASSNAEDLPAIEKPSSRTMAPHGYQLSLPFDDQITMRRLVIASMDNVHGVQFCKIILDLKPRTAIDLRHLIRFDLPGTNRREIFHNFNVTHTLYVKASLPWHKLGPRDFISNAAPLSQRLNHEIVEREETPILILVSKNDDARYLASYLNRALSTQAKYPWKIDQAG